MLDIKTHGKRVFDRFEFPCIETEVESIGGHEKEVERIMYRSLDLFGGREGGNIALSHVVRLGRVILSLLPECFSRSLARSPGFGFGRCDAVAQLNSSRTRNKTKKKKN